MSKIKPVKAWARVYDGKIERECLDTYGLYTTRAAARANWWGEPGEFIRVEIRPVEKVKKEITNDKSLCGYRQRRLANLVRQA